jgi:dTMP kinase
LGLFPFLAGAIGNHAVDLPIGGFMITGTRVTLWIAGGVALIGGILSMRAIRERVPLYVASAAAPYRGLLIAFEGGEGAGKSTQIAAFVQWLTARGESVVTTREPGGTKVGTRIREVLLDNSNGAMDSRAEALLYAADRAQHVAEVIRPALDSGKIVVTDRFVDSSVAYQGFARELGSDEILRLSEWATAGLMPDLVFFLDVDPAIGLSRSGDEPDRIESEGVGFHERVRAAYLQIAKNYPERFVVLDASRSQGDVHRDVIDKFEKVSDLRAIAAAGLAPAAPLPR